MKQKKSIIAYIIWVPFFLLTVLGLYASSMVWRAYFKLPVYVSAVLTAGAVTVCALIAAAAQLLHKKLKRKRGVENPLVFPFMLCLVVLAGAVYRFFRVDTATAANAADSVFYELTKVVAGQTVPSFVHGAVNCYVQLLRKVYFFLGNRAVTGIYLQIVLWMGATLFLGVGMKRICGRIGALSFAILSAFLPVSVEWTLVLSPIPLYLLLWSVCFCLIAGTSQLPQKKTFAVIGGLFAGILTYLDVAGLLLLIVFLAICAAVTQPEDKKLPRMLIFPGVMALTCVVCICADALVSGYSFARVFDAMSQLYEVNAFTVPAMFSGKSVDLSLLLVFGLVGVGAFTFFIQDKKHVSTYATLPWICVLAAEAFGLMNDRVPACVWTALFAMLIAGACVQSLFTRGSRTASAAPQKPRTVTDGSTDRDKTGDNHGETEASKKDTKEAVKEDKKENTDTQSADKAATAGRPVMTETGVSDGEPEDAALISQGAPNVVPKENTIEIAIDRSKGIVQDIVTDEPAAVRKEFHVNAEPAGEMFEAAQGTKAQDETGQAPDGSQEQIAPPREIHFLENPLPLPKQHEKKVMTYALEEEDAEDDYDVEVSDDDDFDLP